MEMEFLILIKLIANKSFENVAKFKTYGNDSDIRIIYIKKLRVD
jgi:hypothetical protein